MPSGKVPRITQNIDEVTRDLVVLVDSQSNDIDKINYLTNLMVKYVARQDYEYIIAFCTQIYYSIKSARK